MKSNTYFWNCFKKSITIKENDIEEFQEASITSFTGIIRNDDFPDNSKIVFQDPQFQIIQFSANNLQLTTFKRFIHPCIKSANEIFEDEGMNHFISEILNEFFLYKFSSQNDHNPIENQFSIIKVKNQNKLIIEFVVINNEPSTEKSLFKYMEDPINILKSMADLQFYGHFVQLLKLISSYDGRKLTITNKVEDNYENLEFEEDEQKKSWNIPSMNSIKMIVEFPDSLLEPESLLFNNQTNLDDWKPSTSYPWGILSLTLLGPLRNPAAYKNINENKNLENHLKIEELVENIDIKNSEARKIVTETSSDCLKFISKERIKFHEVYTKMSKIPDFKIGEENFIKVSSE